MPYMLEVREDRLETEFEAVKSFGFWRPRAVLPTDVAPVVRRKDVGTLYERNELALLRYGLVPPGFSSPREADRYELNYVRAKRVSWQREVAKLYGAGNRCLVPMTRDGEVIAAAGLWGKWTRVRGKRVAERVESFCIFTVKDEQDQWHPLILERFDWTSWLEGSVSVEDVAAMRPVTNSVVLETKNGPYSVAVYRAETPSGNA
jgi:putative SOS response-associated peptidase YedK